MVTHFLQNSSGDSSLEVFLCLGKGYEILSILDNYPSAVIVPRDNIRKNCVKYLEDYSSVMVSAYVFVNAEDALFFRIGSAK
jgi:hypothetical protein